ncbi:MAG TPA: DUF3108 domain-containing protein [Thermoanaerobaculia bacterium]|nr:DUF3108 domain-containing protein [Thermoanaerobaculia bacterium]
MKALAAALVIAQLATPAPPNYIDEAYEKGETLDYSLTWLRMSGGTLRMTIAPEAGDEKRIRMRSLGKSSSGFSRIFRVHDQIESIVDRDTFTTLEYHKRQDEGGNKKEEITRVEGGIATRTRKKIKKVRVPTPVYDPLSIIYYLRTLDLSPGKKHEIAVIADAKLYSVHVHVVRRESVSTELGTFKTILVEPKMEAGGTEREERLLIWYSDDEKRIPVRIRTDVKFGTITATLRGMQSGAAPIDAAK